MFVNYEKKGRIAYFTLNRPEALNAFNPEMFKEISDAPFFLIIDEHKTSS